MRLLNRDKIDIYYANETAVTENVDSSGFYTGEKSITYETPKLIKISRSNKGGSVQYNQFGVGIDYDMTLTTEDINCGINELSKIWVDKPTTQDNDYQVVSINRTPNFISYAIKKVK